MSPRRLIPETTRLSGPWFTRTTRTRRTRHGPTRSREEAETTCRRTARRGQIHGLGGNERLARAVIGTRLGTDFEHDDFWITVLQFFIAHLMLLRRQGRRSHKPDAPAKEDGDPSPARQACKIRPLRWRFRLVCVSSLSDVIRRMWRRRALAPGRASPAAAARSIAAGRRAGPPSRPPAAPAARAQAAAPPGPGHASSRAPGPGS